MRDAADAHTLDLAAHRSRSRGWMPEPVSSVPEHRSTMTPAAASSPAPSRRWRRADKLAPCATSLPTRAPPTSRSTAPWSGCAATCAPTTTRRCTTRCARRGASGARFVFDRAILDPLPRADRRVEFIRDSLVGLDAQLRALARVARRRGRRRCWCATATPPRRCRDWPPNCACRRSTPTTTTSPTRWRATPQVRGALADAGIALHTSKDHVVFERSEVLTQCRQPLRRVHALQERLAEASSTPYYLQAYPVARHAARAGGRCRRACATGVPTLADDRLRAHQPARR